MSKYSVMCYGDSNTWGTVSRWKPIGISDRYDENIRWPCVMQSVLGTDYRVIEEGLPGRTTVYTADPEMPLKNGKNMLWGCLKSHFPLDLIIFMLGTNDIHLSYKLKKDELGNGIQQLIDIVRAYPEFGRATSVIPGSRAHTEENIVPCINGSGISADNRGPDILLISPPEVSPSDINGRTDVYPLFFGDYGRMLSKEFSTVYKDVAEKNNCYFLDSQEIVHTDIADGVHLDAQSHVALGKAVAKKVKEIAEKMTDL